MLCRPIVCCANANKGGPPAGSPRAPPPGAAPTKPGRGSAPWSSAPLPPRARPPRPRRARAAIRACSSRGGEGQPRRREKCPVPSEPAACEPAARAAARLRSAAGRGRCGRAGALQREQGSVACFARAATSAYGAPYVAHIAAPACCVHSTHGTTAGEHARTYARASSSAAPPVADAGCRVAPAAAPQRLPPAMRSVPRCRPGWPGACHTVCSDGTARRPARPRAALPRG
jgi:hypothetical protein